MTFLRTIHLFRGFAGPRCLCHPNAKARAGVRIRDYPGLYPASPAAPGEGSRHQHLLFEREETRIKVLRKESAYSFVLLEDSRTGYVANKNMTVAPPGTNTKPFGSSATEAKPEPRRKKHVPAQNAPASPTPTPAVSSATSAGPSGDAPSQHPSPAPAADLQVAPSETPAPAPKPSPTPAPDKPKFRL